MKRSVSTYLIFILICNLSCIDPIELENPGSNPPYVIDGFISNIEGPYRVMVSQSVPYSQESFLLPNFIPVTDADVRIEDGSGNQVVLANSENEPGAYLTNTDFCGKVGEMYKVVIKLSNGEVIESDYEELLTPAPYKNLIATTEIRSEIKNGILVKQPGEAIYVDFEDDVETDNYYQWRWYSDYQMTKPLDPVPCYLRINDKDNIAIFADTERNGERLMQLVDFIEYREIVDISDKYLLSAEQHSISAGYYKYLDLINTQRSSQGTIFDPIPASIDGNLHFTNNENVVLGYFHTSSIVVKRIEIPNLRINYAAYTECSPITFPVCYDCSRVLGSSRIRPEYY